MDTRKWAHIVISSHSASVDRNGATYLRQSLRYATEKRGKIYLQGNYYFGSHISRPFLVFSDSDRSVKHEFENAEAKIAYAYGIALEVRETWQIENPLDELGKYLSEILGKRVVFNYDAVLIESPWEYSLSVGNLLFSHDKSGIPLFAHFILSPANGIIVCEEQYLTTPEHLVLSQYVGGDVAPDWIKRRDDLYILEAIQRIKEPHDRTKSRCHYLERILGAPWLQSQRLIIWAIIAESGKNMFCPVSYNWAQIREGICSLLLSNSGDELKEFSHPLDRDKKCLFLTTKDSTRRVLSVTPSIIGGEIEASQIDRLIKIVGSSRFRAVEIEDLNGSYHIGIGIRGVTLSIAPQTME